MGYCHVELLLRWSWKTMTWHKLWLKTRLMVYCIFGLCWSASVWKYQNTSIMHLTSTFHNIFRKKIIIHKWCYLNGQLPSKCEAEDEPVLYFSFLGFVKGIEQKGQWYREQQEVHLLSFGNSPPLCIDGISTPKEIIQFTLDGKRKRFTFTFP